MANPLPTLRGSTKQVLTPFTRSVCFLTTINSFMGGQEQRWPNQPPLYRFSLPMSQLSESDRSSLLTFIGAVKGKLTPNITLTLGSTTYSNLVLDQDALSFTTRIIHLYDHQIELRQTQNGAWTPPTPLATYPNLSAGVVAQLPFAESTEYLTNTSDGAYGQHYAYGFYATGAGGNFPSTPLKSWKLSYPVLTDADVATLENAFIGWMGQALSFSFPNPIDSVTYTHVRCDQDELSFQNVAKGQWSTELMLRQTNGS